MAGRPPIWNTPEELWAAFEQYRAENKANPYRVQDYVGKDGNMVYRDKERPITFRGFEGWLADIRAQLPELEIAYFQSNIEGEIINAIQQEGFDENCKGIVLNAGAYTHTSIAIADAVSAIATPVIAVHMSNPRSREP